MNKVVGADKIITIYYIGKNEQFDVCISGAKPPQQIGLIYISSSSPLAQAILNHKEGEEIEFSTTAGKQKIRIIKIH